MNKKTLIPILILLLINILFVSSCSINKKDNKEETNVAAGQANKSLDYALSQAQKTLEMIPAPNKVPRYIEATGKEWKYTGINDWTSGFWPGILWYLYEYSKDDFWKENAEKYTEALAPIMDRPTTHHDLGFMMYCSYGNGYRLTKNPAYKEILLRTADSLATLYNPSVGTILSWPSKRKEMNWPHNTIIDNMMNLELLFWAAKNGGDKKLYDIAVNHATTTMEHHIRPNFTTYHVAVYDDVSGDFIKGVTYQGYKDNSMWARGQAWAIYGFTMCYRETGNEAFLETAKNLLEVYLTRLPKNELVPYWDFDDDNIPNAPKDASAAAIVASALLELSTLVNEDGLKKEYLNTAHTTLEELSSDAYLSKDKNPAFLMHSTGHKPKGSEIDVSINYADYYFVEALIRSKRIADGKAI